MSFLNEKPGKFIATEEHEDFLALVSLYLREADDPTHPVIRQHVFDRQLGQEARRRADSYTIAERLARTKANSLMTRPMTPAEIRRNSLKMKTLCLAARNDFPDDLLTTIATGRISQNTRINLQRSRRARVKVELGFPDTGMILDPEDPNIKPLITSDRAGLALRLYGILPPLPAVPPEEAAVLEPSPPPPDSLLGNVELEIPVTKEPSPVMAVSHFAIG